jgi:hypothetical protein
MDNITRANRSAAEIAGEEVIHDIISEGRINLRSPSASGRCAMAVYHAVTNAGGSPSQAHYWAGWWATDGGDLEAVPDGTAPDA